MSAIADTILEKYQIRKTNRQKTEFIDFATKSADQLGYSARVEKGMFGSRNIVVGDIDSAKVIYTAHYDTCARLPFPNFLTPQSITIYILYNIAIVLGFLVIAFGIGFGVGVLGSLAGIPSEIGAKLAMAVFWALYLLLLFGPANKHTVNDNTSGVNTLFELMEAMPNELRDKAAFVFFDLEEAGLIGSSSFASKHKDIKKNKLIVNFDCVSDGENMLVVAKKKASTHTELLQKCFVSDENVNSEVVSRGLYPSDQGNFEHGVAVAAFNKTKGGLLYMDKIHTPKDTVYRRENIEFIVKSSVKLTEEI